ncbi:PSP1 C-terminal domain-containing protein [Planctomicrobium sp. SH668]|uniref:PSP1 C-terminal domain-containing protein n=1 Tax=Planctomicrobium sp. SH668 TaxID=3448126 RepID=UPI003F5B774B
MTATRNYLIRHGAIPEVVKASWEGEVPLQRGAKVVVRTHRGEGIGVVLEAVRPASEPGSEEIAANSEVLRLATADDLALQAELARQSKSEFSTWDQRILGWGLDLQLIDLEWTLDRSKIVLYVLNERGPECTKLALQVAAAGLGNVEVQPVSLDGLVTLPPPKKSGGGCGSCSAH